MESAPKDLENPPHNFQCNVLNHSCNIQYSNLINLSVKFIIKQPFYDLLVGVIHCSILHHLQTYKMSSAKAATSRFKRP